MFESIEIQQVENGFIVTINSEDGAKEYIFDSSRKVLKFVKEYVEAKSKVRTN